MAFTIDHFKRGDRIEMHPATDRWMMGDRYGYVENVGRKYVCVRLDKSGRCMNTDPSNIGAIIENGVKSYA